MQFLSACVYDTRDCPFVPLPLFCALPTTAPKAPARSAANAALKPGLCAAGKAVAWKKGRSVANAPPSPPPFVSLAAVAALLSGRLCSATPRLLCAP